MIDCKGAFSSVVQTAYTFAIERIGKDFLTSEGEITLNGWKEHQKKLKEALDSHTTIRPDTIVKRSTELLPYYGVTLGFNDVMSAVVNTHPNTELDDETHELLKSVVHCEATRMLDFARLCVDVQNQPVDHAEIESMHKAAKKQYETYLQRCER